MCHITSFYDLNTLWQPDQFHSFFGPYDYFIKAMFSTLTDGAKMIVLAFEHLIMYVQMRTLVCNVQIMFKIALFGWVLIFLVPLDHRYHYIPYSRGHITDYLSTGHSIMYEPMRNLIECMSNIGLMSQIQIQKIY